MSTAFVAPLSLGDSYSMYWLAHGFRRYTRNIPKVLMSTARGRSPTAVFISTHKYLLICTYEYS